MSKVGRDGFACLACRARQGRILVNNVTYPQFGLSSSNPVVRIMVMIFFHLSVGNQNLKVTIGSKEANRKINWHPVFISAVGSRM